MGLRELGQSQLKRTWKMLDLVEKMTFTKEQMEEIC